jgi:hypothetical protein
VREEQRWIVVHEQVAELPELERDARTEREPVFLAVELDVLMSAPDDLDDVPVFFSALIGMRLRNEVHGEINNTLSNYLNRAEA